ncbi:outer surface protein [Streptococcus pyogenes]|nr:outer surface protein [Streptococcus pyogenes]
MSLLQLAPADHQMFHCYAELIAYANQLGIRVIADVSPSFISQAGWSDQLIERAHAFGLAGLRLDEALPLAEIVTLTRNPFGLKIELNMSTDKQLLMSLLATDAERSNIIGCHNFYPHEFTGLSWQHFKDMSRFYHEHDIETAAFITAQSASEGPWLLAEGLPTVEDHRHLPIGLQVELMKAIGTIDNILISNQFISEEELAACTQALARPVTTIKVRPIIDLTEVEEQIIGYPHCYRGDVSDM